MSAGRGNPRRAGTPGGPLFVHWQKEVAAEKLNEFFKNCDVAFDQLGEHWPYVGLFSMLTGRPLIANGRPDVFRKITGEASPVCQAKTEREVADWLWKLYSDRALVKQIGEASRKYVLRYYNIEDTVDNFIKFL